jgi:hypothetical protein
VHVDQRGLYAGRRVAIEGLDQGDTNERCSNIVHPLVSCVFERRQNAYCSAIRGYCLVHRCCDLDRLGHGVIADASVSGSDVAVQHRPKPAGIAERGRIVPENRPLKVLVANPAGKSANAR